MEKPRVRIYTDYKSPYAFVANSGFSSWRKNTASNLNGCRIRLASRN